MIGAISAFVVQGQIALMTFGGQPFNEKENTFFIRESRPICVSVNRVKEKLPHNLRKNSRHEKNAAAKRNHNKWKESKRKKLI